MYIAKFLKRPRFFFQKGKMQCNKCGGRILLGDGTVGSVVMLRPIKFQCAGNLNVNGFLCR